MTKNVIEEHYLNWICKLVSDELPKGKTFRKLFASLYDTDFTYTIAMDENRAEDGISLRYRFGRECGFDGYTVAKRLDIYPCSVLEMMVALSVRCEEHIMINPEIGSRPGLWFWSMVKSLGLINMNDENFNVAFVEKAVNTFLNREYEKNGCGGLFTLMNCRRDMRNAEIWYQMCWYLDEQLAE